MKIALIAAFLIAMAAAAGEWLGIVTRAQAQVAVAPLIIVATVEWVIVAVLLAREWRVVNRD